MSFLKLLLVKSAWLFSPRIPTDKKQAYAEKKSVGDEDLLQEMTFVENCSNDSGQELNLIDEPKNNVYASPFLYSLELLVPEDIELAKEPRKKSLFDRCYSVIRAVILAACAVILVVCGWILVENMIDKYKAELLYGSLADEFDFSALTGYLSGTMGEEQQDSSAVLKSPTLKRSTVLLDMTTRLERGESAQPDLPEEEIKTNNAEIERMKAQIYSLKLRNPDTFGWIYVPNTTINYQVVKGQDNDYYLKHATDGSRLAVGSIFADYRISDNVDENYNTVLYGHNVTNETMFNHVTRFFEEEVFQNTLIYLYTPQGVYVYEPFAIFKAKETYQYFRTKFESGDDFVAFAQEMQKKSKFKKNFTFEPTDKIITLSTCTNAIATERFCLQAKLVQIIQ